MSKVYILKCNDLYKIGVSKDVDTRIKQLQTGNGCTIEKITEKELYYSAYAVEQALHKKYLGCKTVGEWFKLDTYLLNLLLLDLQYEVDKLALVGPSNVQEEYTRLLLEVRKDPDAIYILLAEMANMKFKLEAADE